MARPKGIFNKISEEIIRQSIKKYLDGSTIKECADLIGISHQGLRIHFIKRGVKIRPRPSWKGSKNPKFNNGGNYKNKKGYIICQFEGKKIKKHRKIFEDYHGVSLKRENVIHHKNGIKDDNRIQNLELTNHEEHSRHHANIRWKNKA